MLFVLHGLIHLLGVVRGVGLADVALLSVPISPLMSVLWPAATLLCVAAAAALFLAPRWWWAVGILAVLVPSPASLPRASVTESDLAQLPDPVRRYLRRARVVGAEGYAASVNFTHAAPGKSS